MLRILITDDHAIIRKGLRLILLQEYPSAIIEEVSDAESAIKKTIEEEWDVILCDLSMPGKSGLDVVQYVKDNCPHTPVLILSIHPEEQYAIRAIKAGAAGYLSKDAATQELTRAVQRVLQGRKYVSSAVSEKLLSSLDTNNDKHPHELLSEREFNIFQLIANGTSITNIADKLSIGITTVSTHRSRILSKMNMKSNADLTRYAIDKKLI
jgi:DNA-binding NarL/FixJ family response regulator